MIRNKWQTLFWSSRPISWINTAFPFAAAYLATGGDVNNQFWLLVLYFLIPYNMLIYVVNDVYDYESDLRNPRKGGVEGALVSPRLHPFMLQMVRVTNVPFLVVFCLNTTVATGMTLLLVAFGALAYSVPKLRFKELPVLDSITSSLHFVGPALVALSLTGWHTEYIPYVLAFFLWGMASHAFGAVQDINADRQAKIHSIATKFGAKTTVRFSCALYVICAGLLFLQGVAGLAIGAVSLLYASLTLPYLSLHDKDAEKANAGWKYFLWLNQLAGFVVTITLLLRIHF